MDAADNIAGKQYVEEFATIVKRREESQFSESLTWIEHLEIKREDGSHCKTHQKTKMYV